jgi:hypothetical protein
MDSETPYPMSGRGKKIDLPEGIDDQVREDLMKGCCHCTASIEKVDDMYQGHFSYSKGNMYKSYDKFFNTTKEFAAYADKFLELSDPETNEESKKEK